MSDILSLILQRRSIRKYLDQPIEEEKIEQLLKAAMAAPSAMNRQPWEFVVIRDQEILEKIHKTLTFGIMQAPLAIVVCGNLSGIGKKLTNSFWVQDCSAATQNILLAATGLGLGSVWCGVHPIYTYEKNISTFLGLPEGIKPLNVIFIGYPAEKKEARTQYNPDCVHYDRY